APTITSAATASAIAENSGADQVVYTATADDSSDVGFGVTFSLAEVSETIVVTVVNKTSDHPDFGNGSSKGYFLDGVESPALNLLPGTYIFDQSDSSNATHAINFYASANKTGSLPAGISVTQTGTAGSAGANTQITIADDFDGSIYYQCVNHPYMGNSLSDGGLSINGLNGQVVLSANPDYEAQSTYDFTVVATDGSGNKEEQSIALGITNLDEVAPTITSSATGDVLGFQSKLYSGSASDSSDISSGITYSLKSNVGDEQLLNVNSSNGEVSLKSGVTNTSTKASYDFTLVADDGVNNPAELAVSVDVDSFVSVSGPGVVTQGGIVPVLTSDGNGNLMISLKLDPSVSSNYASGIENADMRITYDSGQIGSLTDAMISFPSGTIATPNNTVSNEISFALIAFPTPIGASASIAEITFPDPNIDAAISIDIKEIYVGNDALSDASYQLGDPVSVSGTSADEVFELAGGNATVLGGGGDDVFALSSSTGSETSISDFLTGSDILEMASLAIENGYTSATTPGSQAQDQTLVKLIDPQNDIADLVSNSDASLDNSFGAFFDSSSAELTVFIDGDSVANSANIDSYKITLTGNSAFDLDDLNLASPVILA
ncbi:MAG: cadherin repeat domain-containing protein, partial [Betaproteobacteria bacterium]|nr:cadherin repeat domain-containing protein [Betaproteobacteria bacterium]